MVVRANILGTVVGPSTQDPWRRITVAFSALVALACRSTCLRSPRERLEKWMYCLAHNLLTTGMICRIYILGLNLIYNKEGALAVSGGVKDLFDFHPDFFGEIGLVQPPTSCANI